MKPRMKTSKKWTLFPKEYLHQIEEVFNDAFASHLTTGKLIIEGRIYPEEILLRVGYQEKGRLKQDNFEVSATYTQENQDAMESIHHCIDAAASMMSEFFENPDEVSFPREWKEFDFDNKPLWIQYSTVNSELESEADKLLGLTDPHLVMEQEESEDALSRSDQKIDPDGQENEDYFEDEEDLEPSLINQNKMDEDESKDSFPAKPSIFSSNKKKKKENLH